MADDGMKLGMDAIGPDLEDLSFEELVSALELLTDRLASGQIGIEEAADLYEQAERLHGLATERLARVQARIEALGTGTAGGTDSGTGPAAPTTANRPLG